MRNNRKVIRTGDTVLHGPTGEKWLVAYAVDDRLAWCGWPEGEAKTSDCQIVDRGDDEDLHKLLQEMTQMRGSDARKRYAQQILKEERERSDKTLFDPPNTIG